MKAPCIPVKLPPANLDWQALVPLIGASTAAVCRYDGTLDGMVNPRVLLSPLTTREAVLSSKIEGTQTSLVEVLQRDAGEKFAEKKEADIQEVSNYRIALVNGAEQLKSRKISLGLIKDLHALLLKNVRGQDKTPGAFRTEQNWIGPKGTPIEKARFVPPNIHVMQDSLIDLEKFLGSSYTDPLVQMAIIHGQFEIIHPFGDGNGRLGRMLIPLFLCQKKVLQKPVFYLSEYLEENDDEYRNCLLNITENDDWQGWIEFFLTAVKVQSERNTEKAKNILALYDKMKSVFREVTRSQYGPVAQDVFFKFPIINASEFHKRSEIPHYQTSNNILRGLKKEGVIITLKEGRGQTPAVYAMHELINIAEGKRIFNRIKSNA
jgi:Fic family protein